MKTSKPGSWVLSVAAGVTIAIAFSGRLCAETAGAKSSGGSSGSATQCSVQVERVDLDNVDLAHSFQVAIYENLLEELNKTKRFKNVFREGDGKASDIPDLLTLKTTVVKYTPGSETQRAVTTVSGATKLTVHSQLITREGKIVLDRKVQGNVRFFGSNLRATHNLARNIAKMIRQSAWPGSEQLARNTHQSTLTPDGTRFLVFDEAQGETRRSVTEHRVIAQSAAGAVTMRSPREENR